MPYRVQVEIVDEFVGTDCSPNSASIKCGGCRLKGLVEGISPFHNGLCRACVRVVSAPLPVLAVVL